MFWLAQKAFIAPAFLLLRANGTTFTLSCSSGASGAITKCPQPTQTLSHCLLPARVYEWLSVTGREHIHVLNLICLVNELKASKQVTVQSLVKALPRHNKLGHRPDDTCYRLWGCASFTND